MVHSAIAHLLIHAKREEARQRVEIVKNAQEHKRRHALLLHCRRHAARLAVYARHLQKHAELNRDRETLLRKLHVHLKTLAEKEKSYAGAMEQSLEKDRHAALKAAAVRHHLHRIKRLLEPLAKKK